MNPFGLSNLLVIPLIIPSETLQFLVEEWTKSNVFKFSLKGGLVGRLEKLENIWIDGYQNTLRVEGTVHLKLERKLTQTVAEGVANFSLAVTWQVDPTGFPVLSVQEWEHSWKSVPRLHLLSCRIPVRRIADRLLRKVVYRLNAEIKSQMPRVLDALNQEVQEVVRRAENPVRLQAAFPFFFRLDIRALEVELPFFRKGCMELAVRVTGLPLIAQKGEVLQKPASPFTGIQYKSGGTRAILARIPLYLSYRVFSEIIEQKAQAWLSGSPLKIIRISAIQVSKEGEQLIFQIGISSPVTSRWVVRGTPVADFSTQTVRLEKLTFEVEEAGGLMRFLFGLFRKKLEASLQATSNFQLKNVITQANQQLAFGLQEQRFPGYLSLRSKMDELRLEALSLETDHFFVLLSASGVLEVVPVKSRHESLGQ